MSDDWVKLGWSFEEAMTALHERLTQIVIGMNICF